jgi:hypothetical protein
MATSAMPMISAFFMVHGLPDLRPVVN